MCRIGFHEWNVLATKILTFEAWRETSSGMKYGQREIQKQLVVHKCEECGKEKAVLFDEHGNKEKIAIWKAKQYLGLI